MADAGEGARGKMQRRQHQLESQAAADGLAQAEREAPEVKPTTPPAARRRRHHNTDIQIEIEQIRSASGQHDGHSLHSGCRLADQIIIDLLVKLQTARRQQQDSQQLQQQNHALQAEVARLKATLAERDATLAALTVGKAVAQTAERRISGGNTARAPAEDDSAESDREDAFSISEDGGGALSELSVGEVSSDSDPGAEPAHGPATATIAAEAMKPTPGRSSAGWAGPQRR